MNLHMYTCAANVVVIPEAYVTFVHQLANSREIARFEGSHSSRAARILSSVSIVLLY